jgi:MATE family multidrug resistance protein
MCRVASSTKSLGTHGERLAEVKAQLRIGVPVAFSAVLRRSMTVWTVGFVGQLGPKAMAAAALANSTTNTFALSIMVGLSSASVTLVSQAVGAKDSRQAGLWLHRALLVHALTAVPLTLFLLCFAPLLVAIGQDADLAAAAGAYAALLIPALWAWAAMWALQPWLQAHGVVRVQTATSAVAALLHPCLLALLVPHGGLAAAAATDSASTCLSVLLLALSVTLVPRKCRSPPPWRCLSSAPAPYHDAPVVWRLWAAWAPWHCLG